MITMQPTRNNILIRLRPLPEKTGLIVRVQRDEIAREADVLSAGPECFDIRGGEVVLVNPLAGQVVGEDILIPETAVLAFVE